MDFDSESQVPVWGTLAVTRFVWMPTILLLFLSLFIISCGSKKSPTGGPVDLVKPEILYTHPLEYEQIENDEIQIAFSKPMDKTSVINGLHINPPQLEKKLTWKKNVLSIKFTEKLAKDKNVTVFLSRNTKCERNNTFEQDIILIYRNGELQRNSFSGFINFENDGFINNDVNLTLLDKDSLLVYNSVVNGINYFFDYLNSGRFTLISYIDTKKNNRYDFGVDPFYRTSFELPTTQNINIFLAVADTVKPNVTAVTSNSNNQVVVNFNKKLDKIPLINIVDDSTRAVIDIIYSELIDTRLHIITAPLDSTKYQIRLFSLSDDKGNNRDTVERFFDSKGKADNISPKITQTFPRNGAVVKDTAPEISLTFDKIMFNRDIKVSLIEMETNQPIKLNSLNNAGFNLLYKPDSILKEFNTYHLIIHKETSDSNDNAMEDDMTVQFIVTQ